MESRKSRDVEPFKQGCVFNDLLQDVGCRTGLHRAYHAWVCGCSDKPRAAMLLRVDVPIVDVGGREVQAGSGRNAETVIGHPQIRKARDPPMGCNYPAMNSWTSAKLPWGRSDIVVEVVGRDEGLFRKVVRRPSSVNSKCVAVSFLCSTLRPRRWLDATFSRRT